LPLQSTKGLSMLTLANRLIYIVIRLGCCLLTITVWPGAEVYTPAMPSRFACRLWVGAADHRAAAGCPGRPGSCALGVVHLTKNTPFAGAGAEYRWRDFVLVYALLINRSCDRPLLP